MTRNKLKRTFGQARRAIVDTDGLATSAGVASSYQPLDADLTALSGLSVTAGLLEQTGPAAFTKRLIGVVNATDIPTRANADARYLQLAAGGTVVGNTTFNGTTRMVAELRIGTSGATNGRMFISGANWYLQSGIDAADTTANIIISRFNASTSNIAGLFVRANASTFYGNITATGNISGDNLVAGEYTPVLTAVANVSGLSVSKARYSRVGNVVTESGLVSGTWTASSTSTSIGIDQKFASNFAASGDAGGVMSLLTAGSNVVHGHAYADTVGKRVVLRHFSHSTAAGTAFNFTYMFQYTII